MNITKRTTNDPCPTPTPTQSPISAYNHTGEDGHSNHAHPSERGEAYIAIMRDLAEFQDDRHLADHYREELDHLTRPLARMTADDLNLVLNGMHNALIDLLDDLISARNRAQPSIPQTQNPPHAPNPATSRESA